jgi:hypothetical protein
MLKLLLRQELGLAAQIGLSLLLLLLLAGRLEYKLGE